MALSVHLSASRGGDDDNGDEYDAREGEEERENASHVGYVVVAVDDDDDEDEVLCGETRNSVICIMSFNQIVSIWTPDPMNDGVIDAAVRRGVRPYLDGPQIFEDREREIRNFPRRNV